MAVAVAVAPVAKSVVAKSVVAVVGLSLSVGLSLGLSLSLPLAIDKSVTVAVSGVAVGPVAQSVVAQPVAAVVAKTVASVSSVEEVGVSLCLGFRLGGSDGRKSENYEQFHVECRMSKSKP